MMFASTFTKLASTMLLELIVMLEALELIERKRPSMIALTNANAFPGIVFKEQREIHLHSQGIKSR